MLSKCAVTTVAFTNTHYETSGNLSAGWGEGSLTLSPKDGTDATVLSFRYTAVARKKDGKWVYVNDHASAQPEGAPAAPAGGDGDDDEDRE
jgi:hypothetical protein